MRKRLMLTLAAVSIGFVLAAPTAYAAQYPPPWAHMNAIPETYKLAWGEGWLDQSGYNCYTSTNLSAYAWYTNMKSDAVYVSCGHGAPGLMQANGGSWVYGKGGTNSWPVYYLSNMSSTDIAIGWEQTIYADSASLFGMGFARGVWDRNLAVDYPLGRNRGEDNDLMQYAMTYAWNNSTDTPSQKAQLYLWVTKGMYGHRLRPTRYGEW